MFNIMLNEDQVRILLSLLSGNTIDPQEYREMIAVEKQLVDSSCAVPASCCLCSRDK